jgi:hypothetical protein
LGGLIGDDRCHHGELAIESRGFGRTNEKSLTLCVLPLSR